MIRIALPVAALALLGACAPKVPASAIAGAECSAERLGSLKGRLRSAEVEAEAMRLSGAKSVRWLAPDTAATMDFRPDRLNLNIDADGKIVSGRCG